jgi:hypothetical protein
MEKTPIIDLSSSDLINMRYRVIGKGSDADIYEMPNGLAYKFYRKIPFTDPNGYEKHISDLVEKQKNIRLTKLPLGIIKVNNQTAGCFMVKHANHLDMNKFKTLRPKAQLLVLHTLITKVQELVANNIYHLDLKHESMIDSKSNILISKKGDVQIIDFDGGSAEIVKTNDASGIENFVYTSLGELIFSQLYAKLIREKRLEKEEYGQINKLINRSLNKKDISDMHSAIDIAYVKR